MVCLPLAQVTITLLQVLSTTAVRLHWNTAVGLSQKIMLGYVLFYRSKLLKRQIRGVQTKVFPPNASYGDISGLEPRYNDYEFSLQVMLNISGLPVVNQPQSYAAAPSLMVLTPGWSFFPIVIHNIISHDNLPQLQKTRPPTQPSQPLELLWPPWLWCSLSFWWLLSL